MSLPRQQQAKAIQMLREAIEKQEKNLKVLERSNECTLLRQQAKQRLDRGDRKGALLCLTKKKRINQTIEAVKQAIFNMESQMIWLESDVENQQVNKIMEEAKEAIASLEDGGVSVADYTDERLGEVMASVGQGEMDYEEEDLFKELHHPNSLLVDPMDIASAYRRQQESLVQEKKVDGKIDQKKKWKQLALIVVVGVISAVLAGVLTGLLIDALTRDSHTHPSTMVPTPPGNLLPVDPPSNNNPLSFLPPSTQQAILSDDSSPQARAWRWLQDHPDYADMLAWRKRQLMGLVTFYYATGGHVYWTNVGTATNQWLNAAIHECKWQLPSEGDCSLEGKYTQLTLKNQGLTGVIPPEIALLASLEHLVLWENPQLSGSILDEMADLTALTHLALVNSKLEGTLPTQMGRLTKLAYLALNNNLLSGSLPTQLGDMTALTWLSLWDNRFRGSVPVDVWGMEGLQHLFLYQNQLTGTISRSIRRMQSLISLGFYENNMDGTLPSELGELTSLTWLSLSENGLRGTIPNELGDLSALTWLSLRNNQLDGPIPEDLDGMIQLRAAILNNNNLYGNVPDSICELPELKFLLVDCQSVRCSPDCSTQCGCD